MLPYLKRNILVAFENLRTLHFQMKMAQANRNKYVLVTFQTCAKFYINVILLNLYGTQ